MRRIVQAFTGSRWTHRLIAATLLATIGWFYYWSVGQGRPLPFGQTHGDYFYNALADGFMQGQLSSTVAPEPALLGLDDPYDPRKNVGLRLHDASLYEGKYYLYFGVTPVILLFLPFRLLGVGRLPTEAAVAFFVFGGVLFSLATLSHVRRSVGASRHRVSYASLLMLGLGGAIPFLMRRAAIYEVAIGCGAFCVAAAVYFLISASSGRAVSYWRSGLGSLFLGLAIGARPNLILATPLLGIAAWRARQAGGRSAISQLLALSIPFAIVLLLLGYYNYARFDSWTEFGRSYQLAGTDVRQDRFEVSRIPKLAPLYLWLPAHVNLEFPYTHVHGPEFETPPPGVLLEPLTGIFYTTPLLYVLACLPFRSALPALRRSAAPTSVAPYAWAWGLVGVSLLQVMFFGTYPGATMRYIVDFSLSLMTAAGIVMIGVDERLTSSPRMRSAVTVLFAGAATVTVFFNLALGITGYYDNLKGANPDTYESLKRQSDRVIDLIVPWFMRNDLELVSVSSPEGARRIAGLPSFSLGNGEAEIEVFAAKPGNLEYRAGLLLATNPQALTAVTLRIRNGAGFVQTVRMREGERLFVIPLSRGHNHVFVRLEADPSASTNPKTVAELRGLGWKLLPAVR